METGNVAGEAGEAGIAASRDCPDWEAESAATWAATVGWRGSMASARL
jgi:hypothetical protein